VSVSGNPIVPVADDYVPPDIESSEETIGSVFDGNYRIMDRMRLACEVFAEDGQSVQRCPNKGKRRFRLQYSVISYNPGSRQVGRS
jgi:hypothetical protein